jgi:hypothetical protein
MSETPKRTSKKPAASAEAAFQTLAAAIEQEWTVPALVDDAPLPEVLRDPAVCLDRGRHLLTAGLHFQFAGQQEDAEADDEEYRRAARNGSAIPLEVTDRMHAERHAAEHQLTLGLDVKE